MRDKKRAMGRGLGAILNAETKAVQTIEDSGAKDLVGSIMEIPIEDIYPNPNQPRTHFDEKALQELSESIKALGIIQPITLKKEGDKFLIISGERRYRASKLAGLKSIPAYIRLVNDQGLLEMALVENIQREDLDAIEVALTYQRLLEEIGLTQEALSGRVGKERSTITNALRLLKLSPDIQQAIRNGVISAGHGRAIISVEGNDKQQLLFDKVVKEKLNVRQTEEWAKKLKKPTEITISPAPITLPNNLRRAEKSIADRLEVKVEIKAKGKGNKGQIILNFMNEEELEKIISYFN